jgi:hypothetical protein
MLSSNTCSIAAMACPELNPGAALAMICAERYWLYRMVNSGFGLHVDLPHAAEAVEVVDEDAAHEGLERLVDRFEGDALLEGLVAIDPGEDLGDGGKQGRVEAADLGPLARGVHEALRLLGEERHVLPRAVLEHEAHAAGGADAGDRGRRESKGNRLGELAQARVDAADDDVGGEPFGHALVPGLEGHEEEPVVGGGRRREPEARTPRGAGRSCRSSPGPRRG